jgi:small multidrug resistance pump
MPYVQLAIAIAIEIVATSLLKTSDGFTRLVPTVVCLVSYGVSFWLIAQSVKTLPIGFVYAVWSGVGTATIAVIGAIVYSERLDATRVAGIALVIAGVVVLNLSSPTAA